MAKKCCFRGLMSPVFTPFRDDFGLNLDVLPKYALRLKEMGIKGILVNGTSGEGVSMTFAERKLVAEAWLNIARETKQYIMVQVGGGSLKDVQSLAKHAETKQADAILCLPDLFFRPKTETELVAYLKNVADAAPKTPLLYYHIPSFTGVNLDMAVFMEKAATNIKTFSGIKFTHTDLEMGSRCIQVANKNDLAVFLGADQIFSAAIALGFDSAIATTLNLWPQLSAEILKLMKEGKISEAQKVQSDLSSHISQITKHGSWVSSMKAAGEKVTGIVFGPPRPPLVPLTEEQNKEMLKYFKSFPELWSQSN